MAKKSKYDARKFRLDDTDFILSGYEDPTRYNNGPLPYADRAKLNHLLDYMNEHRVIMSFHGAVLILFDPAYPDNEPVAVMPKVITIDKVKLLAYDLAPLNLMWSVV